MRAVIEALRRAHARVAAGRDRGATMVEIIVAMTIMTICGAIFTGAMVTLFRVSDSAQAVTNSSQQANQAYQALDKLVRYARAISTPGVSSGTGTTGNWYVELSDTTSGAEVCTQLRLDRTTKVLQQRTWTATNPSATVTTWRALGSGFTNAAVATGDDRPFVLQDPFAVTTPASTARQRLTITLIAQAGPASAPRTTRSSFTLTALNSEKTAATQPCQQVGRP